jgi:hypothetical protein
MKFIIYLKFILIITISSFKLQAIEIAVTEIPRIDKEGPWPEFEVITTINATPIQSVAIYYALDYQQEYVPGVIKSDVIDQPSPVEAITSYEFNTPWPLPNSTYTNGSKIQKLKNNTFKVSWWFIKNSAATDLFGSATFIPHPKGTRLVYRTYIAPKSFLATFFKSTASKDIAKTINAIKNHIELLKDTKSPILKKYEKVITDSLNKKFTYKKFDLD